MLETFWGGAGSREAGAAIWHAATDVTIPWLQENQTEATTYIKPTNRRFNPNLQRVRVLLKGKAQRAYVCTRCLKAGKVEKAI